MAKMAWWKVSMARRERKAVLYDGRHTAILIESTKR